MLKVHNDKLSFDKKIRSLKLTNYVLDSFVISLQYSSRCDNCYFSILTSYRLFIFLHLFFSTLSLSHNPKSDVKFLSVSCRIAFVKRLATFLFFILELRVSL